MSGEADLMRAALRLVCPDCKRTLDVKRERSDPPGAAQMHVQCDRCDDGDRHSPDFYNSAGEWIPPF